jgi:hypothetical protein
MSVDPQKTVAISHLLTGELCQAIKDKMPQATITIHVEPCTKECNEKCLVGCLLPDRKRADFLNKAGEIAVRNAMLKNKMEEL